MNDFLNNQKILNISIFIILLIQLIIIFFNSNSSFSNIGNKNITVENFSSIVMSKYGMTSFGSEKLIKKDENNIFLEGVAYLENDVYKIYGRDISIDIKSEVSSSEKSVEVVNSMGTMNSLGFKNIAAEGKIYFLGESKFIIHE